MFLNKNKNLINDIHKTKLEKKFFMNSNSGSQNNEANTVRFLIKSLNPESFVENALCNPNSLNEKIEEMT